MSNSRQSSNISPRTLFGLKLLSSFLPQISAYGQGLDDFEAMYPEDEPFHETDETARVWHVYMDHAEVYDAKMTADMRDALDVLLVFAGLFASVLTTFVAQTSQQLSPDFAEMTASLLFEANAIQRALANGTSLDTVPSSPLSPHLPFVPSSSIVWVNALWMVSLTLSLLAALLAVIVKQWLRRYMENRPTGSVQERARVRQFRFLALWRWHVFSFVGGIPVIVHISVALFLAGLTVLLASLHPSIAFIVGALTTATFAFYIISQVLPLLVISCPYHTPLSEWLYWLFYRVPIPCIQKITAFSCRLTEYCHSSHRKAWFLSVTKRITNILKHLERKLVSRWHDGLSAAERHEATWMQAHLMSTCALDWLQQTSHNTSALRIVSEAIGALSPIHLREDRWSGNAARILEYPHSMWIWTAGGLDDMIASEPRRAGRLLRARLVISSAIGVVGGSNPVCADELPLLHTKSSDNAAISATCASIPSVQSDVPIAGSRPSEPCGETRRRLLQKEIQVDMTPHFWVGFLHNIRGDIDGGKFASRDEYALSLCSAYVYGTDPTPPINPIVPISLSTAIRSLPHAMAKIASTLHDRLEHFETSEAQVLRPTCDPSLHVYIVECFLVYLFSKLQQIRKNPPQLLETYNNACSMYPIITELVGLRRRFLDAAEHAARDAVDATSNAPRKATTKLLLEFIDGLEDSGLPYLKDLRDSLSQAAATSAVESTVGLTTRVLDKFKHARPGQGCPV